MAPSTSGSMFAKDEKVLCFHQKFLYEAKVMTVRPNEGSPESEGPHEFRVHYKGWKNTWDDWVTQERIRKLTDENRELAKSLRETDQGRQTAARKSLTSTNKRSAETTSRASLDRNNATGGGRERGTKRARDGKEIEGLDKEDDFYRRPTVKIHIPDTLKSILVDDWEKVTKENKLVPLPSETPANLFLQEYKDSESPKRRSGSADADILDEVIAGIQDYFDKCLGRILLYRRERDQWADVYARKSKSGDEVFGKSVSEIYGVEHLLRLFVSLPELIAHTTMDAQAIARLREELFKMTQFLSKNTDRYLSTAYEHVGNAQTA